MMPVKYFRDQIKKYGFMGETKVKIMAKRLGIKDIDKLLSKIPNNEIYSVNYTNNWISKHSGKVLFYYNKNEFI